MIDNAKEASLMTVAVFLISVLLFLSFSLDVQGKSTVSMLLTLLLGVVAFRQAYLLRRGQPAQAVLDGAPLRRVLLFGLEGAMERIRESTLKYGISTAVRRKDFMDDVHLLPILSAALRQECPHDQRATEFARVAEELYDVCTRRPE